MRVKAMSSNQVFGELYSYPDGRKIINEKPRSSKISELIVYETPNSPEIREVSYNEVKSGFDETAASANGGENNMNNDAFKYIIDRLDQDMRDHKQEIRDRDARLQAEMKEREDRYRQDRKELEERFLVLVQKQSEEAKEREERMINAIRELKAETKSELQDIKNSVDRAEQRIDATAKHVHSMVTTNFWGRIATVLAILAVGVSLWAALKPSTPPTPSTPTNQQTVSPK
jgi:hypothetical protein